MRRWTKPMAIVHLGLPMNTDIFSVMMWVKMPYIRGHLGFVSFAASPQNVESLGDSLTIL